MADKIIDPNQFKKTYTVGDLKRDLSIYDNDMEIYFEGFNYNCKFLNNSAVFGPIPLIFCNLEIGVLNNFSALPA